MSENASRINFVVHFEEKFEFLRFGAYNVPLCQIAKNPPPDREKSAEPCSYARKMKYTRVLQVARV